MVAHITYKSQLDKAGVDIKNIDLNNTKIKINERLESQVFGGRCPTGDLYSHGYRFVSSESFTRAAEHRGPGKLFRTSLVTGP